MDLALGAVENALSYADPERLIKRCLKLKNYKLTISDVRNNKICLDLGSFNSLYIVGAGKATAKMAKAVCQILGKRVSGGTINVPYETNLDIEGISVTHGGHPTPDNSGLLGAKKIVKMLKSSTSSDLVLVLISGGGSSLMPLPSNNLTLEDKQKITDLLVLSGASIEEVNVVRAVNDPFVVPAGHVFVLTDVRGNAVCTPGTGVLLLLLHNGTPGAVSDRLSSTCDFTGEANYERHNTTGLIFAAGSTIVSAMSPTSSSNHFAFAQGYLVPTN